MKTGQWLGVALAAAIAGCSGGVSESRVAALETEVNQLKQQPPAAPGGGDVAALRQDVDKKVAELQETDRKMQDTLEALTREVAGKSGSGGAGSGGGSSGDVWGAVAEALGVPQEGVAKLDGDTYKMSRGWLVEELRIAMAARQLPKVGADKKASGVSVKGVKPHSLFDQLGLKTNDVIQEVGGKPTASPADLVAALKGASSPFKVKL